jgi:hypothetical protein
MAISTVSFGNTPQAKDDYLLAGLTEDSTGIVCLDVMANDLGGNAKTLWSLDNGTSTYVSGDPARPADLLTQDTARTEALTTDTSLNGAKIWITTDGKVKYDSSTWSSTFKDQLNQLQAGEFLTDSFTYAIRLGNGTLSWATAYVQISGANDAPTSTNDSVTTNEDTAVTLGVNDFGTFSDVDGDPLAAVKITALPTDGSLQYFNGASWVTVALNQEISAADLTAGKLRFVPDLNESATAYATIGFKVGDGTAFSVASYVLTLNVTADADAPSLDLDKGTANDQHAGSATGNEDTAIALDISAALTDTDGSETLALVISGIPVGAKLSDGIHNFTATLGNTSVDITSWTWASLTVTPPADSHADFALTVTATATELANSDTASTVGTINVTVNAVADIVDDTATTNEDTAVTTNVLANDTFEDPARALTSFTQGTNGTVTRDDNGTAGDLTDDKLVYTPNADFNGADSFTYTVTSGGVTETATVNVTINAVVDIANDSATTNEDTKVTTNVLANDTFEDPARELTSFTQGNNGTVTRDDNGTAGDLTDDKLVYTPNADFNGADSYTYTVTSGGVTETATVNVTINAVVDIVADTVTTNQNTPISFNPITGTNGAEADNFESASPQITQINGAAISVGGSVAVTNGSVSLGVGNVLTFTPAAGFTGTVPNFTYTVLSGGVTETTTITVTVTATNVAPVPHADVWVLSDQTPIAAGTITAAWFTNNDTDADGNPLFVTAVTGLPVGLTANFDGAGHLIDITGTTPATSFTLGYTLSDGIASVVAANSVTVTVLDTTSGDNNFTLDGNDFSYIDALSGTDTLTGDAVLTGNAGIDKLVGNNGGDTLSGGAGNDFLFGNENDDVLNGDAGDDSLDGGNGRDTVSGGAGNDILTGGAGNDTITGGQGNDTINVSDGDDRVLITSALDGKDVISGFDNAGGSGAQDFIDLDALFDTLGVASGAARDARVDISTSGGNTLVKVDVNGAGGFDEAGDLLITLTGVTSGITKGTTAADDIQLG